jgi:hypothetical protein
MFLREAQLPIKMLTAPSLLRSRYGLLTSWQHKRQVHSALINFPYWDGNDARLPFVLLRRV